MYDALALVSFSITVANPWADDSDDDTSEEAAARKAFENVRDNVIFLIDVQPLMVRDPPESRGGGGGQEKGNEEDEDDEEKASGLRIALEVAERMMKNKIMSSPNDKVGVVCFNSREMKNAHSFQNVHQLVPLDVPSAYHIEKISELRASTVIGKGGASGSSGSSRDGGPKFLADIGSMPPKGDKLSEGIWLAHHVSQLQRQLFPLFLLLSPPLSSSLLSAVFRFSFLLVSHIAQHQHQHLCLILTDAAPRHVAAPARLQARASLHERSQPLWH